MRNIRACLAVFCVPVLVLVVLLQLHSAEAVTNPPTNAQELMDFAGQHDVRQVLHDDTLISWPPVKVPAEAVTEPQPGWTMIDYTEYYAKRRLEEAYSYSHSYSYSYPCLSYSDLEGDYASYWYSYSYSYSCLSVENLTRRYDELSFSYSYSYSYSYSFSHEDLYGDIFSYSDAPSKVPIAQPTTYSYSYSQPTTKPTASPPPPTRQPSLRPLPQPTMPTRKPTTPTPTRKPTMQPSLKPVVQPTGGPTFGPTPIIPSPDPSILPIPAPVLSPTAVPLIPPTAMPTLLPTPVDTVSASVTFEMSAGDPPTASDKTSLKTTIATQMGYDESYFKTFTVTYTVSSSRRRKLLVAYTWSVSFTVAASAADLGGVSSADDLSSALQTELSSPSFQSNANSALSTTVDVDTSSITVVAATRNPSVAPVPAPTRTVTPTLKPSTKSPMSAPTPSPTSGPTKRPTSRPTSAPSPSPTPAPTEAEGLNSASTNIILIMLAVMITIGGGVVMLSHQHKKRGYRKDHHRDVPLSSTVSIVFGLMDLTTSYGFCGVAYWQGLRIFAYTSTATNAFALLVRVVAARKTFKLLRVQAERDIDDWIGEHKAEAALLFVATIFFYDTVAFLPWAQDYRYTGVELMGFPNMWTLQLSSVLAVVQTFPALLTQISYIIVHGEEAGSYVYFSLATSSCTLCWLLVTKFSIVASVAALGERFVAMNFASNGDSKKDDIDNQLSKDHRKGAPPVLVELRDPEGEGANPSTSTSRAFEDLNRFDLDSAVKGHFADSAAALVEHFSSDSPDSRELGADVDHVSLFEEYLHEPLRPPTASKTVSLDAWEEAGAMKASSPPRYSTLDLDAWGGPGADLSMPTSDISPSGTSMRVQERSPPKSPLGKVLDRAITHSAAQRRSVDSQRVSAADWSKPGVNSSDDLFAEYLPRRPAPPSATKRVDMASWESAGSEVFISSGNVPSLRRTSMKVEERRSAPPSAAYRGEMAGGESTGSDVSISSANFPSPRPTSMKVEERRPPKSPFAYLNAIEHSSDSLSASSQDNSLSVWDLKRGGGPQAPSNREARYSSRSSPGTGFDAPRFTPAQGPERSLSLASPAASPHIDLDFLAAGASEYKADDTHEEGFDRESAALSRKASYMAPFKHNQRR